MTKCSFGIGIGNKAKTVCDDLKMYIRSEMGINFLYIQHITGYGNMRYVSRKHILSELSS